MTQQDTGATLTKRAKRILDTTSKRPRSFGFHAPQKPRVAKVQHPKPGAGVTR